MSISEELQTKMCTVLVCHDDWYLVYKPEGIQMHRNDETEGLLDILTEQGLGTGLHLVHRLDTPTSGLILVARNAPAAATFGELFETRQIKKQYLAIAKGKSKKKQGTVSGDMDKGRRGSYRLLRTKTNPAITHFRSYSVGGGMRLYHLLPDTGKTHQLRVACKSLSVPILGDLRYGDATAQCDRLYLHAYSLSFTWAGKHYSFAELPRSGEFFQLPSVQQAIAHLPLA